MRITGPDNKYRRYTAARDRILEMIQEAEAGTRLLPETQLCALLGVSRPTVRKAVDELVESGVLNRQPRRGVYVNHSRALQRMVMAFLCRARQCLHNPFEVMLRSRVEGEVARRGHRFAAVLPDNEEQMRAALASADGIVLREPVDHTLLPPGVPVVIPYEADYFVPDATYVLVDDYLAGVTAARYLIALGHRSLAYVGHAQYRRARHVWQEERYRGVCDAAAASELGRPALINAGGDPISTELLAPLAEARVTGVVCANDETAMAVISCLHRMGRQVPEQVSVIGFDDVEAATTFAPPLTTMRSPIGLVVATAIDELEHRIKDPEGHVPRKITLPMTLVKRQSCAAIGR